ncbi:hypothetical protein BX666DRAFT_1867856 [Dichotomocladium elegans]|nr:hypothetical protein BX666DRAFT_1867856 [Dichotomocladium elegans]
MGIRALCRDKRAVQELAERGAEVHQVDYQEEKQLNELMEGVRCVMLIPENSNNRVQEAENIIRVAKKNNVEHMAMLSWVGVDEIPKEQRSSSEQNRWKNMREFQQIEQQIKQQFPGGGGSSAAAGQQRNHCIMRVQMFSQFFYFITPLVQQRNAVCLNISPERRWGTVDLVDAVDAIAKLTQQNIRSLDSGSYQSKQLLQFTTQEPVSGMDLANSIGKALGYGNDRVQYQQVDKSVLQEHLKSMSSDNRFSQRPREGGPGTEKPYTFPLGRYLNEVAIQTKLEWFELADQGKAEKTTQDLKQILGREPTRLQEYIKKNSEQFKQLK